MISTVCLKKLYRYEKIYNNIYIIRLDNKQIIYIRDIRFYKKDLLVEKADEEILPKVIFDKETKKFVFR